LLNASCLSYAKISVAEIPGKGAAAGGGSGFELVPGGVGLLPHEHYKNGQKYLKVYFQGEKRVCYCSIIIARTHSFYLDSK